MSPVAAVALAAIAATAPPFAEPSLPFLESTVDARRLGPRSPSDNLTVRGVCLKAGGDTHACYDTDLLRLAIAWRGGFLTEKGIAPLSYRQPHVKAPMGQKDLPAPSGEALFGTGLHPGCVPAGEPIADPRTPAPDPREVGRGPLPVERGRWEGLHLDGARATVAYTLYGARVHEQLDGVPGGVARTLRLDAPGARCRLVLANAPSGVVVSRARDRLVVDTAAGRLAITVAGVPSTWPLALEGDHVTLALGPRSAPVVFRVAVQAGHAPPLARTPVRLRPFGTGGARWPGEVTTEVRAGISHAGGYAVDDLPLPQPNPWNRRVRPSGLAFLPDGRAVVATIDGDLWTVAGLDRGPLRWRRFASGLHEPQSVVVRDGAVFTFTRNGVTRLDDRDGDGEADVYANFSNLPAQTADTREFPMDMVLRPDGGFTLAKGGQQTDTQGKHPGTIIALSPDGATMEVIATGLRQPYLGIDPRSGVLTASDQQGHWVPSTPVHLIRKGAFYGFRERTTAEAPPVTEPLCWIPHHVLASAAGQVWVTGGKLGPLDGRLLQLDYAAGRLAQVFVGRQQGAVHVLKLQFPSALLKGAIGPRDGHLYAAGFQLWGSHTQRLAGLYRVRYTGRPDGAPVEVRAEARGVLLRFSRPLAADAATAGRFTVRRWGYRRSSSYGSGFFRPDGTPGQEVLAVQGARLSPDRRALFLLVDDLRPAMQMHVGYRVSTEAGDELADDVYLTLAAVARDESLAAELPGLDAPRPAARAARPETTRVTTDAGREIAVRLGCVSCHSTDGTLEGKNGPTWKGLYGARRRLAGGAEIVADERYLRESIFEPARRVVEEFAGKDTGMPSYAGILDEPQVEALILFIRSLR